MIILQAKHLVPTTSCLKLTFTELFDTTRGLLNSDVYINLNIFETTNPTRISK